LRGKVDKGAWFRQRGEEVHNHIVLR